MSERKIANNHYPGLDVVRVIAIAGIVLMHVLANGNYDLSGFLFEKVIGTAGNFTILFMMVSAFGMCCGYYEKFKAGTINIEAKPGVPKLPIYCAEMHSRDGQK